MPWLCHVLLITSQLLVTCLKDQLWFLESARDNLELNSVTEVLQACRLRRWSAAEPPSKDRAVDFLGIGHSKTVFLGAFERLPGGILSSEHVHDYSVSVAGWRLA